MPYDAATQALVNARRRAGPKHNNAPNAPAFQPTDPNDPYYQRSDIAPLLNATNRDVMGNGEYGVRGFLNKHPVGALAGIVGLGATGGALAGGIGGGAGGAANLLGGTTGVSTGGSFASGLSGASGLAGGGSMGWFDGLIKALPAVTSIVGSVAQGNAAGRAADASQAGVKAGIDEQRREFDLIQQMLAPQRQLGTNAINTLSSIYGYPTGGADSSSAIGSTGVGVNGAGGITQGAQAAPGAPSTGINYDAFFKTPDYQFRRDEGTRDIENSFAAHGGALSGNALRGITDFNSNLASGEFNNAIQRQLQMAGLGGAATSQAANNAQYTGANVSNLLQAGGNARASGIVDQSNALTNGLGDLSTLFGDWMKKRGGSTGGYSAPVWGS